MRLLNKIYLLLFISLSLGLKAQNYQERQKQLEAQKISINKEIQQINNLINDSGYDKIENDPGLMTLHE